MKILSKLLASPIVKTIGKVADSALLGGAVANLKDRSSTHLEGKMDYIKLAGALIPIGLLILLGFGVISVEQVLQLAGLGE